MKSYVLNREANKKKFELLKGIENCSPEGVFVTPQKTLANWRTVKEI